jgi:hypothetical protein
MVIPSRISRSGWAASGRSTANGSRNARAELLVADSTIGPNPPNPVPFVLPTGSQYIAFTQVNSIGAVIVANFPKPSVAAGVPYVPSMA